MLLLVLYHDRDHVVLQAEGFIPSVIIVLHNQLVSLSENVFPQLQESRVSAVQINAPFAKFNLKRKV